ncbi:MAG: hypothetical protein A2Z14_13335 [Chloroflexi bacterium RBG_16_48_8]|nr:MAG: hypothetical protein A2Z14_13335 [Chloroflexi bacterium RBG_16_48_8]
MEPSIDAGILFPMAQPNGATCQIRRRGRPMRKNLHLEQHELSVIARLLPMVGSWRNFYPSLETTIRPSRAFECAKGKAFLAWD